MGNDIVIESPPPPDMDETTEEPWKGINDSGMTTLAVNHLVTPHSPRTPGALSAKSMRSDWSELGRLARSESIDSHHSVESM